MAQLLYQDIAFELAEQIERGILQPGERLLGVRRFSAARGVSPSTVVAAYRQLEQDGFIEARERSGFYVLSRADESLAEPDVSRPLVEPTDVSGQALVLQLILAARDPNIINLGAAVPVTELLPQREMNRIMSKIGREEPAPMSSYNLPGLAKLRREVVKYYLQAQCALHPDDVVITSGCQEAVYLSLKVLTQPGDIVALESPAYYGLLQVVESLGLKALEIPTHPREGMSLDALQLAAEQWPIKACVLSSNFSNPLGAVLSDDAKQRLVLLAEQLDFMLIEDDIYGDTSFDQRRPSNLKSFDQSSRVMLCGSFSKTIAPGLRVGWVINTAYKSELAYQKFVTNCSASSISQLALLNYLQSGAYARHVKQLRMSLSATSKQLISAVARHFPAECKITQPAGGCVVWIELPLQIDSVALAQRAYREHISIAPGVMFSASEKYRHHIRLSFGYHWSDKFDWAIQRLGHLIQEKY
ncbi:PLP-dependent aminotransferase family protein [Aurantivibrio plasticivorans]